MYEDICFYNFIFILISLDSDFNWDGSESTQIRTEQC
jgi:hypothetical protein